MLRRFCGEMKILLLPLELDFVYLKDIQKGAYLQAEMVIEMEVGIHFVKATYLLEGNGSLALTCCGVIAAFSVAVDQAYPNTQAVERRLTTDPDNNRCCLVCIYLWMQDWKHEGIPSLF